MDEAERIALAQKVFDGVYVFFQFSDGKEYRIPAWHFAYERAVYYAEGDEARGDGPFLPTFIREIHGTDRYDIEDYCTAAYNWADVKDWAELVTIHDAPSLYEEEWCNVEHEVMRFDETKGKWVEIK